MIAEGYFDDVDCVLSAHANGETEYLFDINSTLAGFLAKKPSFLAQRPTPAQRLIWAETPSTARYWHRTHWLF